VAVAIYKLAASMRISLKIYGGAGSYIVKIQVVNALLKFTAWPHVSTMFLSFERHYKKLGVT
jgi:hypothetical protein